jgi:SAM-dependent methyltransferase
MFLSSLLTCRLCHAAAAHRTYRVKEMLLGTRQSFDYFQCSQCQALQITSIPSDIGRFYPSDYSSFDRVGRLKLLAKGKRLSSTLFNDSVLGGWIARVFGPAPMAYFLQDLRPFRHRPIVDVGCGVGTLLQEMHVAGFTSLVGIDPYADTNIPQRPGLRIAKQDFLATTESFDVIMFNHSLEHVPDMAETLRHAFQHLAPDGRLVVRIPVLGHAWDVYGTDWVQLDAPRHFHLFSVPAFEAYAWKQGFEVMRTICDSSDLQFWGSEQYRADIPMNDPRSYSVNPKTPFFTAERLRAFHEQAEELNRHLAGDSAYFLFKKVA